MLTIGAFAKLSQLSTHTLRHYDRIGLLRPIHIGAENGYRYYDISQLATIKRIETLKRYGFKLADIGELLALPEEELATRLHSRRLQAYGDLYELRKTLRRMEDHIIEMEGTGMNLEKYHVIIMDAPAQRIFGLRKTINISQTHQLFQELYAEAERRQIRRSGVTQLRFLGDEFSYDAMDVEAQMEVQEDGDDIRTIPAGTFVATTHIGPYETLRYAYEAIQIWMAKHPAYTVTGPNIERYIKDEDAVAGEEELETGILFPVTKR